MGRLKKSTPKATARSRTTQLIKTSRTQAPFANKPFHHATLDRTLTPSQAKAGGFRTDVVEAVTSGKKIKKGAFRSPSNPTKSGHSSGYHEAFGTTDSVDHLSRRTKGSKGLSSMPAMSRGIWKKHSGATFYERNVGPVMQASDGARTDTARMVLSVPGGGGAGHSGSGMSQKGQASGHDVLRDQVMRTLKDPALTPSSAGVLAGTTALFSTAPGEVARTVDRSSKMKDQGARASYEANRNQGKREAAVHFQALTPPEQATVMTHMNTFVQAMGHTTRYLEPGRPHSPMRDERGKPGQIHGGGYLPKPPAKQATAPSFPAFGASSSSSSSSSSTAPKGPVPKLGPLPTFSSTPPGSSPAVAKPAPKPATPGAIAMAITQSLRAERT
ncbi:hypothetical protein FHW69_000074 [Luteibacter sp. Sphag1AF]|uniref:hypothetical protein n=1 Tax=Luteibacter sp. Sphag1AF TaxID=2587031 RepID=UPI00161C232F|nr:hypothetical protein [Luteibacter sp. Sphag1AF]MBB3225484.1 hypothetical protein [Luteibacter sp. Sphag1AF]